MDETPSEPTAAPSSLVEHSLYDLFLKDGSASPTRWLIQNAEDMPKRLLALLQAREREVPDGPGGAKQGWLFAGVAGEEIVHVKDVRWDRPADLIGALNEESSLGRPLRVSFEITSVDGRKQDLERIIPGLPFPTPWGTYVNGANQEILSNKLVQKPGIFPVNLQEVGALDRAHNAVLFHTPTASILQGQERIVAIVRSLTNALRNDGGRNKPVSIPRAAWAEFDAALADARSHSAVLDIEKYPQLVAAFRDSQKLGKNSRVNYLFSSWIRELAQTRIPDGSWTTRLARIGASEIGADRRWSLKVSRDVDQLLATLRQREFIPFSSLARLKVQTGADILAEMLAQLISARIQEFATTPDRRNQPARSALSGMWASTQWRLTQDLVAATQTGADKQVRTLANEKTPSETAIRVNSLTREGHIFGPADGSGNEGGEISRKQRETHMASTQFYLSAVTMENASVGTVLHMLPRTRVRAETGELEAPFVVRELNPEDPSQRIDKEVYLNSEELEELQADLAQRGLGIAMGRPQEMPGKLVNLHLNTQVVTRVPANDIPAYFDAAPEDVLPLGLRMLPDNTRVEVARHFIALGFTNGASSCYGSEPDRDFSEDALKAAGDLLNTGKFVRSPIEGIIESVESRGRIGAVTIVSADGERHKISYPVDLSNAFSNATGMACIKAPGERVSAGEALVVPDQACVINSVKLGTPGVFPAVPLRAAEFSVGEEDLLVLSAGVKASGKLTILKQANTASINGSNGPIRLATVRPGTMILPGDLLAWQQVQNTDGSRSWKEIRAGESDRGVLANVFVVPDKAGHGGPVEIAPTALAQRPSLARHVQELLAGVTADFKAIADEWKPEVKSYWAQRGHDVTTPYETATMWTYSFQEQQWQQHSLTFAGIQTGPGHPEYDTLAAALQRPSNEAFFGSAGADQRAERNYLETRLHHTLQFTAKIAERIAQPPPDEMPSNAKRVVFSLLKELPVADGDKGAALGTKGSIAVLHPQNLPMSEVRGQVVSAEVNYAVLGFFARSSWGDMEAATKGENAATLKSVVMDPNRGLLEVPVRYGTYRFLRQGESNPKTAASNRGMPNPRVDLSQRSAGYNSNFQAQDGRKGNRADHTLMPDARPALEVGYAGNRDSRVFLTHLDRVRTELEAELPMVERPGIPAPAVPMPDVRLPVVPEPVGPDR